MEARPSETAFETDIEPETRTETEPESEAPEPWRRLDDAHRLLRETGRALDRIAAEEGWPVPFSPVRYLVLAHLADVPPLGLIPRRIARLLTLPPSSLAHHLDVLEAAELIERTPLDLGDQRRAAVRLTPSGRYAVRRMASGALPLRA